MGGNWSSFRDNTRYESKSLLEREMPRYSDTELSQNDAYQSDDPNVELSSRKEYLFQKVMMNQVESLDYHTTDNEPLRKYYLREDLYSARKRQQVAGKWIIYLLIGLLTGLIAFGLKKSFEYLFDLKWHFVNKYIDDSAFKAFWVHFGFSTLYGLIACVVVLICGPLSGASGIPEVKGYLNGIRIPGLINIKTFVGKLVSIIFAYSSGLALGPEGPMVHLGAMIGGGLSGGKSRTFNFRLPAMFESLRSDKVQRDFISSGTAAGVAAAFGAPIGGVLFALEETSSFWSKELTWRTFFGSMISVFMVNALVKFGDSSIDGSTVSDGGLLSYGLSRDFVYRYWELIIFGMLGIIGGLLGALFVRLNIRLNEYRRDKLRKAFYFSLVEVFAVAAVTSILKFGLSMFGTCQPLSDIEFLENSCESDSTNVTDTLDSMFCDKGEYNDFANLFLLPQDEAIQTLFSRTKSIYSMQALVVFLIVHFALVTICAGLTVAGGLFVPMMLVGATYGRIVGKIIAAIFNDLNPPLDPSIYALVGCTAMMAGYSRTTISVVVIIIELTENTQYLLPIMLAVMLAKWTGDIFSHGIYEELMELKSVTFLGGHPPHNTYKLSVQEVMHKDVICFNIQEKVSTIIDVLRNSMHHGFPVVKDTKDGRKVYCGFILKKQLLVLLHTGQYAGAGMSQPPMLDYEHYTSLMNRKWDIDKNVNLPDKLERGSFVMDLEIYMDKSHPIMHDAGSFLEAYRHFHTLGLRHLPIVDSDFQVVGIVTRHDLVDYFDTETEDIRHLGLDVDAE